MPERLTVSKTYKLFIKGGFPRTESGRTIRINDADGEVLAHVCRGSRKDLREAVEAASGAFKSWSRATAYLRGQILYRMAEMLEGKSAEFVTALRATTGQTAAEARREVTASIDRLVAFAGWSDKYSQVLGCHNPVAGPYYNFTIAEPSGVVGVVTPDTPPLLGLATLIAPVLAAGNAVVVIAHRRHPLPAAIFGEVCATADVPAGVVNIITADRGELLEHLAGHREVIAVAGANLDQQDVETLRLGTAENLKRVNVERFGRDSWLNADETETPWRIEPFVEFKTIWHPSS